MAEDPATSGSSDGQLSANIANLLAAMRRAAANQPAKIDVPAPATDPDASLTPEPPEQTEREDHQIRTTSGAVEILPGSRWKPLDGFRMVFQGDGNLVIYDSHQQAVWASGTHGKNVARMIMQDDGNLVMYDGDGAAVWATGTSGVPNAALELLPAGILVIRSLTAGPNELPRWVSHVPG